MMKKIILLLFIAIGFSACYDDYVKDYDYTAIYFPKQINTRTVVVGEGMKIEIGAVVGGVRKNEQRREVHFEIDESFITPDVLTAMQKADGYIKDAVSGVTDLALLPANYYTLSNSSVMVIEVGEHSGSVVLRPDSAKFLGDPRTLKAEYVLPLKIVKADADKILDDKDSTLIGLKYENMLFGNYWHGGVTVVKDPSGKEVEKRTYYTVIPQPDNKVFKLKTVAPFQLETNRIGDISGTMLLTLKDDGTIVVGKAASSAIDVQPNGKSSFNKSKLLQNRKLFLNYKYLNSDGNTCFVTDTLTFRNRIRDGVNEWRSENPGSYK